HPLLKKYGFKAMLFVVTSWVHDGEIRPYWGQKDIPKTPNHHECQRLIEAGQSDQVILRWSEMRQMQEEGTFEIHSHTHTHTRWDKSDRAAEKNELMAEELALSRAALEKNMGSVSDHFCWPQGYFDDDYVRVAKQAG